MEQVQWVFVKDTGKRNVIFMQRRIPEKSQRKRMYTYFLFHIAHAKSFDRLCYNEVLELKQKLDIFLKDSSIIQNVYSSKSHTCWKKRSSINIKKNIKLCKTKMGLLIGLFSRYCEAILSELILREFIIGDHNNNIRYVDGIRCVEADRKKKLKEILQKVLKRIEKKGLINSCKKRKCLIFSKK